MWTRNWDNYILAITTVTGSTSTTPPTDYDPPIRYKAPNGSSYTISGQAASGGDLLNAVAIGKADFNIVRTFNSGYGSEFNFGQIDLFLGQGTNAESYEDYSITDITNSTVFTILSTSTIEASTLDTQTGAIKGGKRKIVVQYTGSSQITISEYAIAINMGYGGGGSYPAPGIVYRKLLDAPITLSQYDRLELVFEYPDIIPDTPYPVTP